MNGYNGERGSWRTCPALAFTEHTGEHGGEYPPDRERDDDTRPAGDPRFAHPESATGSVGPAATTSPFIIFSGVPDVLMLNPGTAPATFTFFDDAGRQLGTADLAAAVTGGVPLRCRRVDVTVPGGAATVVTVTGYYSPALRTRETLDTDRSTEADPPEAPAERY